VSENERGRGDADIGSLRPSERLCIVTAAYPMLDPAIEPATTVEQIAKALASRHGSVAVLTPYPPQNRINLTYARQLAKKDRVDLHCLFWPHGGDHSTAYAVHQWLRRRLFTRVLFVDALGLGYWALSAKWQGIDYDATELSVLALAPSDLIWRERGQFLSGPHDLQRIFMEWRCAELADVVIASAPDVAAFYAQARVKSEPPREAPLLLGPDLEARASELATRDLRPDRCPTICYAGALDSLDGLELFCNALRALAPEWRRRAPTAHPRVVFVGRRGQLVNGDDGGLYALAATAEWPGEILVGSTGAIDEDLTVVLNPDAVVVAASPAAARSTLVRIAAATGVRIVAPEGSVQNLCGASAVIGYRRGAKTLAEAILAALTAERPSLHAPAAVNQGIAVLRAIARVPASPRPMGASEPTISVCMSYFNRPKLLEQAIESLRRQTYPTVEVVIVDDASPSQESRDYTASLASEFAQRGWKLLRNETERWQSSSRNRAVREASGDYILIMDDDNVAHSEELEVLRAVSERTGAEVVWCFQNLFDGEDYPNLDEAEARVEFYPVGPFASVGPVWNTSGDVNALFRRKVFLDLGGYTERVGVGCEDYEIGVKVALAGIPWAVVPRPLYGYRFSDTQMAKSMSNLSLYYSHRRVVDLYIRNLPSYLGNVSRIANDQYLASWQTSGIAYWHRFMGAPDSFARRSREEKPIYTEAAYHLAANCLEQGAFEAATRLTSNLVREFPQDNRLLSLHLDALVAAQYVDEFERTLANPNTPKEMRDAYAPILHALRSRGRGAS
jgi:glycosyltransferase involved in cell wall biosynthesis